MKFLKKILNRLTVVSLALAIQLLILIAVPWHLGNYYYVLSVVFSLLSLVVVSMIINKESDPAVKLAWIVPILVFPFFGWVIYLLFGTDIDKNIIQKILRKKAPIISDKLPSSNGIIEKISQNDKQLASLMSYTAKNGFPAYTNTETKYYKSGEEWLPDLLEDLKSAENFIFMEFFIIKEGQMWSEILKILEDKAKAGLDVRIMYDDVGSINQLPSKYYKKLREKGIKCIAFNRFMPFLSIIMNNRDHRKIAVIDGKVGFTGGANLADEYINVTHPHGYWKDAAVRLEGNAVMSLTSLFLEMWNSHSASDKPDSAYKKFVAPQSASPVPCAVQPYGDSPLDNELLSENIYLSIINRASDYLYIFTPYLITDNVVSQALILAAKRGVDVRIVIPGIPDKKAVYQMTVSHSMPLMSHGVTILTYEPGFIHSKCFVSDDSVATVGTVNLDNRSLKIHFECGCIFYGGQVVKDLYSDAVSTFEKCLPLDSKKKRFGLLRGFWHSLLRLFAPLM